MRGAVGPALAVASGSGGLSLCDSVIREVKPRRPLLQRDPLYWLRGPGSPLTPAVQVPGSLLPLTRAPLP